MTKVQKVYTKEFKEEAVKLMPSSGKSAAQVARDLCITGKDNGPKRVPMPSLVLGIKVRLKRKIGV